MKQLTALLAAAGIAVAPQALAATATSTFNVTMTIVESCSVTDHTDLNFGSANGLQAAVNQTSTIEVTCTNSTPYTIGLDAGTNASDDQRRMMGGATNSEYISYGLYRDTGHTTPWGNAEGSWADGTGTGSSQVYTVYGRVPAQASPSAGNYTDTVTVTVTY